MMTCSPSNRVSLPVLLPSGPGTFGAYMVLGHYTRQTAHLERLSRKGHENCVSRPPLGSSEPRTTLGGLHVPIT